LFDAKENTPELFDKIFSRTYLLDQS